MLRSHISCRHGYRRDPPHDRPRRRPRRRARLHRLRHRNRARLRRRRRRARAGAAPRRAGGAALHPRDPRRDVPRPALDDAPVRRLRHSRGHQRALPLPDRARLDRSLDGLRPADPARPRLRRPALQRRGRPHRGADRHDRGHADLLRPDPARQRLDLDDDQRAGGDPAAALRAGRRGTGRAFGEAARHGPERRAQGVHGARQLHLPARADDAPDHRHLRVLPRERAEVEHDLDLRLPHPREGLLGRAGGGVHALQRDRLRRSGAGARPEDRRVRAPPRLLLQRPQPGLPGDRQVPRGAADVGEDRRGALRGRESELDEDPLPHPDRRRDAAGPAARGQHHPRRPAGLRRRLRRHPEPAHQRLRRGAGAADRALGPDRPAHPAGARPRVRRRRHRRPLRRLLLRRVADRRGRSCAPGS